MIQTHEEQLSSIITGLAEALEQETLEENNAALFILKEYYKNNEKRKFFDTIETVLHDFTTLLCGAIDAKDEKNKYILMYIVNGLYEEYFYTIMKKTEGCECSKDKSTFIRDMTLKAIETGENQLLYKDYSTCDWTDSTGQAYWSPRTIKDTDEAIKSFDTWHNQRESEKQTC